ncbi:energy transducer TonB [Nodularia chucula]|uniref:energy transducer TonB n=1 Tax=Nodularia chucula TaxID=3093667 RepID=UPI0039C644C8
MGVYGITIEYRSREDEALKKFLIYSLIGSMALHITVLSLGIGNLLTRVPAEIEDEPIDITIIDFPLEELKKAPEEVVEEEKIPEPTRNEVIAAESQPQITPQPPVVTPPLTTFSPPTPRVETLTPPPPRPQAAPPPPPLQAAPPPPPLQAAPPPPPTAPSRQEAVAKLESLLTSESSESNIAAPPIIESNNKLQEMLSGIRDSRVTPEPTASNIPAPLTNESSNQLRGTLNGIRDSRVTQETTANNSTPTNNTRVQRSAPPAPVAAAPTTVPTTPARTEPQPSNTRGNPNGSLTGRAACVQCNTSYPEFARRQGIEGRVEVAVDTDARGNVTNVRIVSSSGNRRLDEEMKKQAASWRLEPSEGGRRSVSIATDFALEGSQRHRQVEERQREERKRKEEAAARERSRQRRTTNTPTPPANEAKPATPPVRTPSQPAENNATGSSPETRTNATPTSSPANLRDSLRNVERESTSTNSAPKPEPVTPAPKPEPAPPPAPKPEPAPPPAPKPAAAPPPAPKPAAAPPPPAPTQAVEPSTNRRPRATENPPSSNENQLRDSLLRSREPAQSESSESSSEE